MDIYELFRTEARAEEKAVFRQECQAIAATLDKRLSWRNGCAIVYIRGDRNYTIEYGASVDDFKAQLQETPLHTTPNEFHF